MPFDPMAMIQERSREEWFDYAIEHITNVRIWIQENGEKSAILFLVIGIALVIFFKIILVLSMLAALLVFAVWYLAVPTAQRNSTVGSLNSSKTHSESDSAGEPKV